MYSLKDWNKSMFNILTNYEAIDLLNYWELKRIEKDRVWLFTLNEEYKPSLILEDWIDLDTTLKYDKSIFESGLIETDIEINKIKSFISENKLQSASKLKSQLSELQNLKTNIEKNINTLEEFKSNTKDKSRIEKNQEVKSDFKNTDDILPENNYISNLDITYKLWDDNFKIFDVRF